MPSWIDWCGERIRTGDPLGKLRPHPAVRAPFLWSALTLACFSDTCQPKVWGSLCFPSAFGDQPLGTGSTDVGFAQVGHESQGPLSIDLRFAHRLQHLFGQKGKGHIGGLLRIGILSNLSNSHRRGRQHQRCRLRRQGGGGTHLQLRFGQSHTAPCHPTGKRTLPSNVKQAPTPVIQTKLPSAPAPGPPWPLHPGGD